MLDKWIKVVEGEWLFDFYNEDLGMVDDVEEVIKLKILVYIEIIFGNFNYDLEYFKIKDVV